MKTLSLVFALLISAPLYAQPYTETQAQAIGDSYSLETAQNYAGAIRVLRMAGIPKGDYFVHLRLGWLYYLTAAYDSAITYYTIALGLQPKAVDPYVGILNCRYYGKDYKGAIAAAKAVHGVDPANVTAWQFLVAIDIGEKNYSSAELRATEGLRYHPIDFRLNINLAYVYNFQGRKDDAKAVARRLRAVYGKQNAEITALMKAIG